MLRNRIMGMGSSEMDAKSFMPKSFSKYFIPKIFKKIPGKG